MRARAPTDGEAPISGGTKVGVSPPIVHTVKESRMSLRLLKYAVIAALASVRTAIGVINFAQDAVRDENQDIKDAWSVWELSMQDTQPIPIIR